jgi:DNA-binding PadR family transcriptional regulator
MPAARPRTATTYAVLGLLSVRSWTTYELAKQVQRSLNWFWPRAERKLYDEPKALVADGLAAAAKEFTGQRPRTVYEITDEGRRELRAWLSTPSAPSTWESEAMVKVFFADAGTLDQLRANLRAMELESEERLAGLVAMVDAQLVEGPRFPERRHLGAIGMRLRYEQEKSALLWTRWAQEQVAGWRGTSRPGRWDEQEVLAGIAADFAVLVPSRASDR